MPKEFQTPTSQTKNMKTIKTIGEWSTRRRNVKKKGTSLHWNKYEKIIQDQNGGNMKMNKILRGETWKQTNVSLEGKNKSIVIRIQNLGDDMHLCPILKFKTNSNVPHNHRSMRPFFQIFRSLIRKMNKIAFKEFWFQPSFNLVKGQILSMCQMHVVQL